MTHSEFKEGSGAWNSTLTDNKHSMSIIDIKFGPRLTYLYRLFVDYPEMAALTGIYPKTDVSHGFPNPNSYEMYRDFQENTINSDVCYFAISKRLSFF